jgi:hypothetical protein
MGRVAQRPTAAHAAVIKVHKFELAPPYFDNAEREQHSTHLQARKTEMRDAPRNPGLDLLLG